MKCRPVEILLGPTSTFNLKNLHKDLYSSTIPAIMLAEMWTNLLFWYLACDCCDSCGPRSHELGTCHSPRSCKNHVLQLTDTAEARILDCQSCSKSYSASDTMFRTCPGSDLDSTTQVQTASPNDNKNYMSIYKSRWSLLSTNHSITTSANLLAMLTCSVSSDMSSNTCPWEVIRVKYFSTTDVVPGLSTSPINK